MSRLTERGRLLSSAATLDVIADDIERGFTVPLEVINLLGSPDEYVRSCQQMGMSRAETESSVRALLLEHFQTTAKWDAFLAAVEETIVRQHGEGDRYRHPEVEQLIEFALRDSYGDRSVSVDQLVRFLESGAAALKPPRDNDRSFVTNELSVSDFGPLLWFRNGSPDIKLRRTPFRDVNTISVAWITERFGSFDADAFALSRVRRARQKDMAGSSTPSFPYCAQVALGWGGRVAGFQSTVFNISSLSGEAPWFNTAKRSVGFSDGEVEFSATIAKALPALWRADVTTGGPVVRLIIGPHEAKELFALREIEDGKKRRDALLHIVRKHDRRKPFSENDTVVVRKHIRGKSECSWMGCSVKLSAPDLGLESVYTNEAA